MYSPETGRVKGLEVECLESRLVPAGTSLNSLFSTVQLATEIADRATTPTSQAPAGSLAAVGQAARQLLVDTGNLGTDVGALAVDASVFTGEGAFLKAAASSSPAFVGALTKLAEFAAAEKNATNAIGIGADVALLGSYIQRAVTDANPDNQTSNLLNVGIQVGVVVTDLGKSLINPVLVDVAAVAKDLSDFNTHRIAFNNAVQQFGGYGALLNVGVSSASSFVSSGASTLAAGVSELQAYAQSVFSDVQQAAISLFDTINQGVSDFDSFLQQLLPPPQPAGTVDPDNDDDDDTGIAY